MMTRADDEFARTLVRECRVEVDAELKSIHDRITENMWTPDRAEKLAEHVLTRAIPQIEDRMMMKLKIGVGEATLSVGKRAAQIIGVFVLAAAFWISSHKWPWSS
jgi:hypothetical protein